MGFDYFQYAGAKWCDKHCLRHHIYLIPKDVELLGFIDSGYETGLSTVMEGKKEHAVEVQGRVVPHRIA